MIRKTFLWALAAYSLLVAALMSVEALVGGGFDGRTLHVQAEGWRFTSLQLDSVGMNGGGSSFADLGLAGPWELSLKGRALRSAVLIIEGGAPAPGAKLKIWSGAESAEVFGRELKRGPDGAWSVDIAPLIFARMAWTIRAAPLYLDLGWGRLALFWLRMTAALLLCLLVARWLGPDFGLRSALVLQQKPPRWAPLLSAAIAAALYACRGALHPWAFTQNDNLRQFLPKFMVIAEQLSQGHLPWLDPYTAGGAPLLQIPTYPFFDPLVWVSWGLAWLSSGGAIATFEVYGLLAVALAAGAMHGLLACLEVPWRVAMAAALAWATFGFFAVLGGNWYYVLGLAAYLPLIFFFLARHWRDGRLSRAAWVGAWAARSLLLLNGNPQLFAYALIAEAVAWVLLARKQGSRPLWGFAINASLSIAVALPWLLPQAIYVSAVRRWAESATGSGGIDPSGLTAMVLPWPLAPARFVGAAVAPHGASSHSHYLGLLWVAPAVIGILQWLRGRSVARSGLLAMAVLALLASLGRSSLIQLFYVKIPLIGGFRFLYKLLPFAAFGFLLWSALAYRDRLAQGPLKGLNAALILGVILHAWVLIGGTWPVHPGMDSNPPYPPLDPAIAERMVPGSLVLSLADDGADDPRGLGASFGGAYKIRSSSVYDEFAPKIELPSQVPDLVHWAALQGYTHVLAPSEIIAERGPESQWAPRLKSRRADVVAGPWRLFSTGVQPWTLRGPEGQTWLSNGPTLPTTMLSSDVMGTWELSLRWNAGLRAWVDQSPVQVLASPRGWAQVEIPAGNHELRFGFSPKLGP